ncbi:MAG: hypothetical protein ACP5KL_03865 [Thermoplasmata archaeon]
MDEKMKMFMEKLKNPLYEVVFNTYYQGKKLWIALKINGIIVDGLKEKWKDDPEVKGAVEDALRIRDEKIKEEKLRNSWQVQVLSEHYTSPLYDRSLPRDLYFKLKKDNHIYYVTASDLEEMGEFFAEPGWKITEEGKKILREEAEKTATPEMLEMVKKIRAEREENARKEKEKEKLREEMRRILKELDEIEATATLAPRQNFPSGEMVDDPRHSWQEYDAFGGGHVYVIDEKKQYIYFILNNGRDGDDWSRNNIMTGGAGAIGWVVPYNEEIEKKLRRLKEIYSELHLFE